LSHITNCNIRKPLFKLGDTAVKVKPVKQRNSSPKQVGESFCGDIIKFREVSKWKYVRLRII